MLTAKVAGVESQLIDFYAQAFLTFRFFYNFLYIYGSNNAVASARSLVWFAGMSCVFGKLFLGLMPPCSQVLSLARSPARLSQSVAAFLCIWSPLCIVRVKFLAC